MLLINSQGAAVAPGANVKLVQDLQTISAALEAK